MAHFETHCHDCERLLNDRCEDVNHWLDECFAQHGPHHRFVRHHTGGIEEATKLFGERGRKAALIHILRDCGHIPTPQQWERGEVDEFGIKKGRISFGGWDQTAFIYMAKRLIER